MDHGPCASASQLGAERNKLCQKDAILVASAGATKKSKDNDDEDGGSR